MLAVKAVRELGLLMASVTCVRYIIDALSDNNHAVVREVITALAIIRSAAKDAIPALEKLSEHDHLQIAERAKAALRQIRDG